MISKSDVEKIAVLAKLSLTEEERVRYQKELSDILQFVEKLDNLDLENVEVTSHAVEVVNVFREDEAKPSTVRDKALEKAPATEGDLFKVPKVL